MSLSGERQYSARLKRQIARMRADDKKAAGEIRKLSATFSGQSLSDAAFQKTGRLVNVKDGRAFFKGFDNEMVSVELLSKNPMASIKKKRKPGKPSPAQLRARRKFAAAAKARAKAARAAKRAAGIKTPTKKRASATKPPKKRNVLTPDRNHPVEVTRHWRKGGASAWQRAEAAGQRRLFAMNGKRSGIIAPTKAYELVKVHNTRPLMTTPIKSSDSLEKLTRELTKRNDKTLAIFDRKGNWIAGAFVRTYNGKKSNGSGIAKAKQQRKEFLGSPARKVTNTTVPKGAKPKGALSKMGRLMRVKVKGRSWMDFQGVPMLARDAKNKMFVTGTAYKITAKGKRRNPDGFEDLGEITHIEYAATKTHLDGYPVTYVHELGEEGGAKPHAIVNSDGHLLIEGGDYTITSRGIEN